MLLSTMAAPAVNPSCPHADRQVAQELLRLVGLPWEEQVLRFHEAQRNVATASMAQVGEK